MDVIKLESIPEVCRVIDAPEDSLISLALLVSVKPNRGLTVADGRK